MEMVFPANHARSQFLSKRRAVEEFLSYPPSFKHFRCVFEVLLCLPQATNFDLLSPSTFPQMEIVSFKKKRTMLALFRKNVDLIFSQP